MYKSKSYYFFYLYGKILIVTFMTVRREYVFKTFSIQTPRFVYVNNKAKIIRRGPKYWAKCKKAAHTSSSFLITVVERDNFLVSLLASKEREDGGSDASGFLLHPLYPAKARYRSSLFLRLHLLSSLRIKNECRISVLSTFFLPFLSFKLESEWCVRLLQQIRHN